MIILEKKYRSDFGEVDVAPAKNYEVNKVTKINCSIKSKPYAHLQTVEKNDVQSCIKIGMKLYKELHLQGNHYLYTFIESEVRK